ncbi:TlpA disulfide reductase family protein [Parapedobacter tibetensis]|uniref:TlpA disulfide reductase family protein n=1 Tax=Parapedobacter tibetensis TaxID=2972951 RepID=UPI00214D991C|nr:TlpA disulfide reductase family protein [Parapedobacter tibetensis]
MTNWPTLGIICIAIISSAGSTNKAHAVSPDSCLIVGELIGAKRKNVILFKASESPLVHRITIPVIGNAFRYKMESSHPEAYMVVPEDDFLEGPMRPMIIFTEGTVTLKLHPVSRYEENRVNGGSLNQEYQRYQASLRQTFREKWATTVRLWEAVEADSLKKDEALALDSVLRSETLDWEFQYVSNNRTLVSYYILKNYAMLNADEKHIFSRVKELYPAFVSAFPNHPYTSLIGFIVKGKTSLEDERRFIDFEAEDLEGNAVDLQSLLAPKATLINFWASWCGPCIIKTRTMLPIYEKFKNKGFDIINVAREFDNTDALKNLLERENHLWKTNLVDLNGKYSIWEKYTINTRAGMMVLIDGYGNVLAVDPTADQVNDILAGLAM